MRGGAETVAPSTGEGSSGGTEASLGGREGGCGGNLAEDVGGKD